MRLLHFFLSLHSRVHSGSGLEHALWNTIQLGSSYRNAVCNVYRSVTSCQDEWCVIFRKASGQSISNLAMCAGGMDGNKSNALQALSAFAASFRNRTAEDLQENLSRWFDTVVFLPVTRARAVSSVPLQAVGTAQNALNERTRGYRAASLQSTDQMDTATKVSTL